MDHKVIWTDPAIEDLRAIALYIAEDNVDAAYKLGEDFFNKTRQLEYFPKTGKPFTPSECGGVYYLSCRGYYIYYQIYEAKKAVEILHVRHGSRQEPKY